MTLKLQVKRSAEEHQGPTLGRLPEAVAREEGYFEQEGVQVEYIDQTEAWITKPRGETGIEETPTFSRHYLFEEGHSGVFGACEWGQIRRAHDSKRGGRVIGHADGAQWHAIVAAPNSPFRHPRSLYNQPVSVRFHAGSHYATLELLEGFLEPEEIKLVNLTQLDAFEALQRGEIAAVTLPEPWITFAQKQGFRVLAETREYSAEIGAPDVDPQAYAAYNRARRRGAELLNANKEKYLKRHFHSLIGSLPKEFQKDLTLADFNLHRFHWFGPQPYTEEDFARTYNWMVKRQLIPANVGYDRLVNREFLAVA
jgi:NitT/TauT family transport system substrate-binding protein